MASRKARTTVPQILERQEEKEAFLEDLERMGCGQLAELP
jgi:hypothetical protein